MRIRAPAKKGSIIRLSKGYIPGVLGTKLSFRAAVTRLVEDQLHEAESVIWQLDGRPHSLSLYVEFALVNYRKPLTQKLLAEGIGRLRRSSAAGSLSVI
jgi:hypothetical protein